MYILIVSRGYPTDKYKTNGIFEFDQAKALAQSGNKVIYAFVDIRSIRRTRKWGYESTLKDNVIIEGINIPCGRIPKKILDLISAIALKKLYSKIEKKYCNPDIIHAHFIRYGYITVKALQKQNIPIVLTEHFSKMNQEKINKYYINIGNYAYQKVDKLISVSKCLANNIKEKFGVEAIVVPNIVDTKTFTLENINYIKDKFVFITAGNLNANKKMDLCIEAFYSSFKDNDSVNMLICGDGPERIKIEGLIHHLGLENRVFLTGLISRTEIAVKFSKSHCFVLASDFETFGVVFIEAMSCGLPVISTKSGGPEDFINDKNGLLVKKDNVSALSGAMIYMHDNIEKYDRKEISDNIRKKYSPQSVASELTNIYGKLIEEDFM